MVKITKKQRVINYFLKHPLATPQEVSSKFAMAKTTVYSLRKLAMKEYQERNAIQVFEQAPAEAVKARARQVGGDHYKTMGVQPWDVVDTWPREQRIGYYRGGALKYLMRMGSKDQSALEIAKGQHYIQKLLEVLKEQD